MRAAVMYGAGDVRVETVADPKPRESTDAVVRVVSSCVCGSDLHLYRSMPAMPEGLPMGHEFIGVVEDTGWDVTGLKSGDLVVAPFSYADNTCALCREGLHTSCPEGGIFSGAQAEAVLVPHAEGTLVRLPVEEDSALLPSLLTLADVYTTGHHAAVTAGVRPGKTTTVVGDGAVGLLAVLSARRLGAERIILMGRHTDRTDLGRRFGATDVVAERGPEGIERVRELTGGEGTHTVLEAVGHLDAYETAVGVVRAGGVVSRVGVPQYERAPIGFSTVFGGNITLTGGPTPVRSYIEELLPDVLEGRVEPGLVFDRSVDLERTPEGYRAMHAREALKVLVRP
ncbi:alcohol dehydrogenase catalytic domain-containing protein [Nocardiopsis alba]|uniref:alcohol dehydrogenase catalytic domain-containing protein n=1 Tax=Nocardiopsis TaxID=2013 RepID=UPI002DBA4F8C|nr:alcohol dehydrogenase catalytic domain-containing protein [Nocardiopsis sp. LDBS1602]MEC3894100.1 alcohol dehydrogenase catalytic domain-containing protein [Nocardiopsis sp. LDBS1602]